MDLFGSQVQVAAHHHHHPVPIISIAVRLGSSSVLAETAATVVGELENKKGP